MSGVEITQEKQIARATVSKSLKEANQRIKDLLENTARSNKIRLDLLIERLGYARGYSPTLKMKVYFTYSPVNGIQVWYDHKGTCEICEDLVGCRESLLQEFKERNLKVPQEKLRPSDLSQVLFNKIEGMLK